MLADHRDGLSSSRFLAWSSIAQSVCQQAFSLLVNRYLRPWVRILPSAEEDNLSPFDSNIACLCQSIEINNNKHVYRQSQVRKPIGSKVEWAECLLIIGTGCRVPSFLAWSSIAQSVCQQAFSLLVNRYLRPWVRILPSAEEDNLSPFDSNIACLCQSIEINNNKHVCMYVCMCIYIYTQNDPIFWFSVFRHAIIRASRQNTFTIVSSKAYQTIINIDVMFDIRLMHPRENVSGKVTLITGIWEAYCVLFPYPSRIRLRLPESYRWFDEECSISGALATAILQSCTKSFILLCVMRGTAL